MSRRSYTSHRRTRRSSRLRAGSALALFLLFAACLGAIAATSPVADGVVGLALVVVAVLLWSVSGRRSR